MINEEAQQALCHNIETKLNRKLVTRKDFSFLSETIFAATSELISESTLMRVWGHKKEMKASNISYTSLSILSRFLGYNGFEDFVNNHEEREQAQSGEVSAAHVHSQNLEAGRCIEVKWQPNRVVVLRYDGDMQFTVVKSENSHLQEGDTACCHSFLENEPLYLTHMHREGMEGEFNYVCGKKDGVTFTLE